MATLSTYKWILIAIGFFFASTFVCLSNLNIISDWQTATMESLTSSLTLAAGAFGLQLLLRNYPTHVGLFLYSLGLSIIFAVGCIFLSYSLLKWVLPVSVAYQDVISDTFWLRVLIFLISMAWIAFVIAMQKKNDSLEASFKRNRDAATLLKEAELYKLHQQLQPHFIYNSLNSINSLIYIDATKAQEMIGKLSAFLRSSVKKEVDKLVPISEEIAYIQNYLSIESIRFGDRLNTKISVPEQIEAMVPSFLLQPVLENAIRYGLYGNTGQVNIDVVIEETHNWVHITISNPVDAETRPAKGTGFGLNSIKRRLYLLFARTDLLETEENENTFITRIKIPQIHVQSSID